MTTDTEISVADQIKAEMERQGISIVSVFVPWSQSRYFKAGSTCARDRSLNWKITIKKSDREILTTNYMAGIAHCPSYNDRDFGRPGYMSINRDNALVKETETGRAVGHITGMSGATINPEIPSVISCLCSDADAIDAPSFEDWAADLGYDTDSRAAEATYRVCLDIALKLRNGLGDAGFAALRTVCEDY